MPDEKWRAEAEAAHVKGLERARPEPARIDREFGPTTRPEVPAHADVTAFYGILGDLARMTQDYVESDAESVLFQLLATFGIAAGTRPHFYTGATRHAPALYVANIGRTSKSRKGTGWEPIETLFRIADPRFMARIMGGIGSGEKLVHLVRDPGKEDLGEADRRLLLREGELARLLVTANKEGSTLSMYLREAFDGKPLNNLVKKDAARSTVHHIGLVGHCTEDELHSKLKEEQIRNGLANRILWVASKRARLLPSPPPFTTDNADVRDAAARLRAVLTEAQKVGAMRWSAEAAPVWERWYRSVPDESGIVPTLSARAEPIVTRLAMIYALADQTPEINVDHLTAALAVWNYSTACVRHIWGATTGDLMADRVLEELAWGPMIQSDISAIVFTRNVSGQRLEEIRNLLERQGRIVCHRLPTGAAGGRPAIQWKRIS